VRGRGVGVRRRGEGGGMGMGEGKVGGGLVGWAHRRVQGREADRPGGNSEGPRGGAPEGSLSTCGCSGEVLKATPLLLP